MALGLSLTSKCNLECKYCYLGDRAEYSLKKADVLNELNNSDEETLYLTGGEPTLHPNFNEILNKGLSLFSNVIFFTNTT